MDQQSPADMGRKLDLSKHVAFTRECYQKEDRTRLMGYLKNAKYREQQKTGEFKMITVLRNRYLGGVPKPGGFYKRVSFLESGMYLLAATNSNIRGYGTAKGMDCQITLTSYAIP